MTRKNGPALEYAQWKLLRSIIAHSVFLDSVRLKESNERRKLYFVIRKSLAMAAQKFTAAEILDMLENVQDNDLDHYHEELEQESGDEWRTWIVWRESTSLPTSSQENVVLCVQREKNTNWQSEGHKN